MIEFSSMERNGQDGHYVEQGPETPNLYQRILQTERDQSITHKPTHEREGH
jgi:hypothetical protein